MLRSAFAAFLGAAFAGAAIDTVRDRVLDTFYPAPPGLEALTVVGLALTVGAVFALVHLTRSPARPIAQGVA